MKIQKGASNPTLRPASGTTSTTTARPAQGTGSATRADGFETTRTRPPALGAQNPSTTAYGSASFEQRLDMQTHSRAVGGNQITMLYDGVTSFAERKKMIEGAQKSIHLQTFIFTDDDTGWELARMLAAKAESGVKVRVIYDAMGSNRSDAKIFEFMKNAGVEVRPYGDPVKQFWDVNDRWHEKHLIVDGKAAILGGMNIANEYAFGGSGKMVTSRKTASEAWRDTDAKLEGPAVADAQNAFLKNWKELGPDVPASERAELLKPPPLNPTGSTVRVVQARPDEEGDKNVNALYLNAIKSAQKTIAIENAYFLPPKDLRDALIDAAKRGVDVKVMTNSRASNDTAFVSDAARYFYDEMIAAGVKIYEKQGGTLHAKTATFDGSYSIVGSANLNGRSKGRDSEVVMAITDPGTAQSLTQRFETGLGRTRQVTVQELEHETFGTNLRQWAFSTLAWMF